MSSLQKVHHRLRNKKITSQPKAFSLHNTVRNCKLSTANIFPIKSFGTRPIPIYLFYKKQKFIIKASKGMKFHQLKQLLYEQIIRFEYQKNKSLENISKVLAKILGFNTCNNNLKVDYMLSLNIGTVTQSLLFECFYASKKCKRLLNYQIYNCLAIGGFSKVYLARSRQDGRFYAIKFIKKKENSNLFNESSVTNEMKICSGLEHPFIVNLREGFETQNFHCMVFQYCPGGELFFLLKRVKRMSEDEARFYFLQILLGIQFLHQQLIIYRDLKPENILIDHIGNIKIVDFGLSKKLQTQRQKSFSFCGSTEYMAPEMILRMGHSFAIDYYSLGALLYQLVVGLPPFYSKDQQKLKQSIVQEQLAFPSNILLSEEIKDLLSRLLHKDSKIRLGSYIGIKQIKCHPWIKKIKAQQILQKKIECPFPTNLEAYNFDINQLGDDEHQFANIISHDMNSQKSRQKFRMFVQPPKIQKIQDQQMVQSLISDLRVKERTSYRNSDDKQNIQNKQSFMEYKRHRYELNNSYDKRISQSPPRTFEFCKKLMNKKTNKTIDNNQKCEMQSKLMPYLSKNFGIKKELLNRKSKRKIPKSNILKIKVYGNRIIEQDEG